MIQSVHRVSVIDGKTNTVTANIKVGNNPSAVSTNPSTYVLNGGDNTVSVIKGKTNTLTVYKNRYGFGFYNLFIAIQTHCLQKVIEVVSQKL
jgi:DNA-binding beta-propeller fold protein YncE